MRNILLLSLIASSLAAFAQKKEVNMEYLHKFTFDSLNIAGQRYRLLQYCTTDVDSALYGRVSWKEAQIGKIKTCSLSIRIINDTLREYVVETSGRKNTKQLEKQANEKYGNPPGHIEEKAGKVIYTWNSNIPGTVTTLELKSDLSSGKLVSRQTSAK